MVSLTKHVANSKDEIGTYLYYTGLDNSSTSSVAAHLNQIANIIGSKPQLWFGRIKNFKVSKAVYASYNAFGKTDVIVTVNLPGAVSCHVIDSFGEKSTDNEQFWKEVYVSGIVRSLLSNDENEEQVNAIVESRNLNPFFNKELAIQFFDYFEDLFLKGPDLGSAPEVQNPTLIDNYLIDGFLKAVELTQLYDHALQVLNRLRQKEESVVSLIVKVLLLQNEEIKAIKTIYDGLNKNPRDSNLLIIQSEFLVSKHSNLDLALNSAIRAVNSSPSDFKAWSNLSKVYLELGEIESALLTLNSCPMSSFKEKFHLKRIIPTTNDRLHLPLPTDVYLEDVASLDSLKVADEHQQVDQTLSNLQAANLKSTFAKAYEILTKIVHKTGWESLLKYRAKIFVMEEEYKVKSSSTTNVPSTSSTTEVNQENGGKDNGFKTKRLCERWLDNLFMLLYDDLKTYTMWQAELIHFQAQKTSYEKLPLEWEYLGMCAFRLHHYKEASFAFKKALDGRFAPTSTRNLLKYYTQEVNKLIEKSLKISSNQNHEDENSQTIERKVGVVDENILECIVKLSAWNHRWYCEFAPFLLLALTKIVEREGLVKIQSQIRANYPEDSGVLELLEDSLQFLKIFETIGSDS